jgi:metal-dependent amidase/aminoacylase/carboxypeptidase family protein
VRQIEATARGVELTCGVRIETAIERAVPVTMNSSVGIAAALASAARVVGAKRIAENVRPVMASEDFSLFLERVPGAFIFIGQDGAYCHHPEYVFDPAVIPVGAALLVDLAVSRCQPVGPRKPARAGRSRSRK